MRSLFARSKELVTSIVIGAAVGLLGGGVAVLFLNSLNWADDVRVENGALIFALPLAGFAIGLAYHNLGSHVSAGSNLVLEEIHEPGAGVPRRMAPMVFLGTVVSQLFGASTGREGAGIQITASVTDAVARLFSPTYETRRLLLITSIAAALAGLFGVPIAGVVFALEVQESGRLRYDAILSALVAAVISFQLVEFSGLKHLVEGRLPQVDLSWAMSWQLVLLAGASAALARSFISLTHFIQRASTRFISWPPLRPAIGACVVLGLVAASGSRQYLGLSPELARDAFVGAAGITAAAFIWKLLFTSVSLGTGFVGGEMVPLFIIGALAGSQLANAVGANAPLFAAVGMVATFAAASNTPLACIVIGIELFGAGPIIPIAVGCVLAYGLSGHHSIYHAQKRVSVRH
jgi:H+/Cl- antiporter ClcA